ADAAPRRQQALQQRTGAQPGLDAALSELSRGVWATVGWTAFFLSTEPPHGGQERRCPPYESDRHTEMQRDRQGGQRCALATWWPEQRRPPYRHAPPGAVSEIAGW